MSRQDSDLRASVFSIRPQAKSCQYRLKRLLHSPCCRSVRLPSLPYERRTYHKNLWSLIFTVPITSLPHAPPACTEVPGNLTVISEDADVRIGLKDNECGAMGVMSVAGTKGDTIQPPAEMLYAVEPDGDAMMRPSPCAVVTS